MRIKKTSRKQLLREMYIMKAEIRSLRHRIYDLEDDINGRTGNLS